MIPPIQLCCPRLPGDLPTKMSPKNSLWPIVTNSYIILQLLPTMIQWNLNLLYLSPKMENSLSYFIVMMAKRYKTLYGNVGVQTDDKHMVVII